MNEIEAPEVLAVFNRYPSEMRQKLLFLQAMIFDVAQDAGNITSIEETIKWGEPSYLSKHGSTIRMAWKASKPSQYALYFHCKTKLIDTFKELYCMSVAGCYMFLSTRLKKFPTVIYA